jgi:hypothetical protein
MLLVGLTYGYDFNALAGEGLGCGLGSITRDAADLEGFTECGVAEDAPDDGTTLVACRTKDCDKLGHGDGVGVVLGWIGVDIYVN